MKKAGFIALVYGMLLAGCSGSTSPGSDRPAAGDTTTTNTTAAVVQQPGKTWIDNFRLFRDAVYQADLQKAMLFVDVASLNAQEGRPVWDIIQNSASSGVDRKQNFTANDCRTYFKALFPKPFIECILKIKSEKLYTSHVFNTELIIGNDSLVYLMYATFDKETSTLNLNLAFSGSAGESDEDQVPMEYNYNYNFAVLPTGQLLLKEVQLVG